MSQPASEKLPSTLQAARIATTYVVTISSKSACNFTGSKVPLYSWLAISVSCLPHGPMTTMSGMNFTLSLKFIPPTAP